MKNFFAILAIFPCLYSAAVAGSSSAGTISGIHYFSNGTVLFTVSATPSGKPSCASGAYANRWAIDASTSGGKAQLAGLLAAQAQGEKIAVQGANVCSLWGDTETVHYFWVAN